MARHSLAYPSVPASAPTSPAIVRGKAYPPATPQRVVHRGQQRLSSPPYTPVTAHSTPYTPLSLRSFSSSAASSLATPVSATSNRRLSFSYSPEDSLRGKSKKGAADTTNNWRTRANENGIRVSAGEESQYADDEADDCSELDASRYLNMDKSLLPAPFLSAQRRARALTHIQPQVCAPLQQISDPSQLSTPARASHSQPQPFTFSPAFLNTPPPKPSILNKYRLRGTVTDPAHTRRRPAFEQASELFDINEDEYIPYPPAFSSTPPVAAHLFSQTLPLNLNDPFDLSSVSDDIYYDAQSLCVYDDEPEPPSNAPFCSVCGTSSGSLAVLEPCTHPLCSACLTSALNIVGEKDMECAVCKAKVDDFKIKKPTANCAASFNTQTRSTTNHGNNGDAYSHPFGLMPSVIDDGFQDFIDRAQGASTPIASAHSLPKSKSADSSVLRIDNVPWDITPPAIAAWLRHPVERVHVLLDRKGKTQSHAYAEMVSPDAAKAALRTSQNSVLGKGKRARGVTVTRSNQEELMRAVSRSAEHLRVITLMFSAPQLFPSWKGTFDGARPSLANLDNEHVIATLQHGLISDSELKAGRTSSDDPHRRQSLLRVD
ncbi:hypothetical protein PHLCEN_2v12720 [Hermanssonia centrifuga]|uniref:RING-type domain-containing protein n=1 Tax=Hermanssonia centrifuga TaxID=98765 RepID=A0A2R6NGK1_9APHY|nr:hypothetical protein PHLCEN_2v12720 [Hermanssonia centrifuga]